MLATPVPNVLALGAFKVVVVEPLVKVPSAALYIVVPSVYLPPSESPGVKYQSKPKLRPRPIALPEISCFEVDEPTVCSIVELAVPKFTFNPK